MILEVLGQFLHAERTNTSITMNILNSLASVVLAGFYLSYHAFQNRSVNEIYSSLDIFFCLLPIATSSTDA